MSSELAKRVAGTFIADEAQKVSASMLRWTTETCRTGTLAVHVKRFCEAQNEILDPALVVVESVSSDCIQCRIPCRCCDHESARTFPLDVKFRLDPQTGTTHRLD